LTLIFPSSRRRRCIKARLRRLRDRQGAPPAVGARRST